MVTSKRFQPVKRVSASREQKAARAFGSSRRRMQQQEAKLVELKQFHKEYLGRFQGAAQAGISAAQLQEYRAFLGKLERAIREQEQIVSASLQDCSDCKQNWQHKHMRTQVMGKVMARYQNSERKQMESREQKETDDLNQRGRRGGLK